MTSKLQDVLCGRCSSNYFITGLDRPETFDQDSHTNFQRDAGQDWYVLLSSY